MKKQANTQTSINTELESGTFADGMTAEDDRRFLELTNDLTHNAGGEATGAALCDRSPRP